MLLSFGTTLRDGVLLPKVLDSFLILFIARCQTPLLHIILTSIPSALDCLLYNSQHTYCTLYVPSLLFPYKILDSFRKMLLSVVRVPGKKSKILESSDCELDT